MSRIMMGIIAIASLFFVLLLNTFWGMYSTIDTLALEYPTQLQKAQTFQRLQSQWGDTKRKELLLEKLDKIESPTSSTTRSNKTTLVYKGLSMEKADKLAHAILSENATLAHLSLKRQGTTIDMVVEVEK